ncbi:hypothetical protein BGZ94_008611, partial [Podila epigama]
GSDRVQFNTMLASLTNLQAIIVDRVMLSQRRHVLQGLDRLPYRQLRYLRLPHITNATSIDLLLKVCDAGRGIRHLELMDSEIDDSVLSIITELCPRLKSLDLSRNEVITLTDFIGSDDSSTIEEEPDGPPITTLTTSQPQQYDFSVDEGSQSKEHGQGREQGQGQGQGQGQEQEEGQEKAHAWPKETIQLTTIVPSVDDMLHDPYCLLCCVFLGWHENNEGQGCNSMSTLYHQQDGPGIGSSPKQHPHPQWTSQEFNSASDDKDEKQLSTQLSQASSMQQQQQVRREQTQTHVQTQTQTQTQTHPLTQRQKRARRQRRTQKQKQRQRQRQGQTTPLPSSYEPTRPSHQRQPQPQPRPRPRPQKKDTELVLCSSLLKDDEPFAHLEELSLVFCLGITDPTLQRLFRSFRGKSLRALNLQFTNIEDSGLETLARTLAQSNNRNTKSGMGGLTSLKVSYCNKITAKGIRAVVMQCPRLLELEFLSCDNVSAECFKGPEPWACSGLQRLEFTFHPMIVFARPDVPEQGQHQKEQHEEDLQMNLLEIADPNAHVNLSPLQVQQQQQQEPLQRPQKTLNEGNSNRSSSNNNSSNGSNSKDRGCGDFGNTTSHGHEDSVQKDYHAMFRQLKRLKRLKSLHIYNSPLLNLKTHPGDREEGMVPAWVTLGLMNATSAASESMQPSTDVNAPLPEGLGQDEVEAEESNGNNNNNEDDSQDEPEEPHPTHSRQNSTMFELGDDQALQTASVNTLTMAPSIPSTPLPSFSSSPSSAISPAIPTAVSSIDTSAPAELPKEPEVIHPFRLTSGLKALKALKQVQTLTLYERCSVQLDAPEVRWLSKHLPQLSILQLRGTIEISAPALTHLQRTRPDLHIQVCSLFE